MNGLIACSALLAVASAGSWHGVSLQGPGSRTALAGPDGSHIAAAAPGGAVHHEITPGVVAHAGPVYGHAAPAVGHQVIVAQHAAPWGLHGGALLAGPSGAVSAHGLGLAAVAGWAGHGSGWEGQWAPDHGEALYDDGSYKPHVYGH